MDRTSWIAVIICSGLLFFFGWKQSQETKKYNEAVAEAKRVAEEEALKNPPAEKPPVSVTGNPPENPDTPPGATEDPNPESIAVETFSLKKDRVEFELTNKGAGISSATLLDYNVRLNDPSEQITVNANSNHPIGAFSNGPKNFDQTVWEVVDQSNSLVSFRTTTPEKLEITKTFALPADGSDSYLINLDVTLKNVGETAIETGGSRFLYLGSMAPMANNEWAMQIGYFWKEREGGFEYLHVDKFKKGFFRSEKPSMTQTVKNFDWAGVNGQFFTTMLKSSESSPTTDVDVWASRFPVDVEGAKDDGKQRHFAIEAAVAMPNVVSMTPGTSHTQRYEIFTGPKEFNRLKKLGDERQLALNYDQIPIFGFLFGWAIKPLASWLTMGLHFMHNSMGMKYGLAIILITIAIRVIIWPVYAKSTRTMKRMSKLTPKMTALKEKHKDNPQKMNEETMKLYRDYGVNPLGGCLPMFIQLPVFLSFYRMLWSEVDLRHVSFLWVDDLSMPDTQFEIPFPFFGFSSIPVNPLPILMAITSFAQMALTPKTGDKTQRMIFMLMPVIFLVICYNFAAALSLYWTTQNAFSIFQTWLMNKLPEPELKKNKKKGFMAKLQEQAAAQQKAKQSGQSAPAPGADRTKLASEKGDRHTPSKKKKKKR